MRIVNVMNFVRQCDPREQDSETMLFETTSATVALVKEFGVKNTFLLQYDALVDAGYQALFRRERDENMELGLWLEIVKPLCDKADIPWRGRADWTWDWHVVPGFSMAYTRQQRKRLIDIAMADFKAIWGHYPMTVASWLLDSFTVSYLAENYPVKMFAICRDQTETDAYTLVGGYFNQGYYPSRNNVFTPAQTPENQVNVPVFRLLGPDPIHNYDGDRCITNPKYLPGINVYTMEPAWMCGKDPDTMDWFFRTYFENETMAFSYAQLGQENSFGPQLLPGLRMQLEKLQAYPQVTIMTMGETGAWFRNTFPQTPVTADVALTDWDGDENIQSIYYNCKNYCANLFRHGSRIFLRSLYRFDETVPEHYLHTPCDTWDASYENQPVVDTLLWKGSTGMTFDLSGGPLSVRREGENLLAQWDHRSICFTPDRLLLENIPVVDFSCTGGCEIRRQGQRLEYCHRGRRYAMGIDGAELLGKRHGWVFSAQGNAVAITLEEIGGSAHDRQP